MSWCGNSSGEEEAEECGHEEDEEDEEEGVVFSVSGVFRFWRYGYFFFVCFPVGVFLFEPGELPVFFGGEVRVQFDFLFCHGVSEICLWFEVMSFGILGMFRMFFGQGIWLPNGLLVYGACDVL